MTKKVVVNTVVNCKLYGKVSTIDNCSFCSKYNVHRVKENINVSDELIKFNCDCTNFIVK